jgi:DNA invertase Pin-like site-specific DNA recombinase
MKRYDTTPPPPPPQDNRLPVDYDLAIYARQSTAKQLVENVESTIRQSEGLKQQARRLGWNDRRIILYVENQLAEGVYGKASGTLRIDDRPHLKALVERILNDEVKAVLVEEVNRLFRDETGVQAATFANYCKEHHCLVLTADDDCFNFTQRGDLKRFLREAEYSADYIAKHIKGVMCLAI